jgi:hypothetical protein
MLHIPGSKGAALHDSTEQAERHIYYANLRKDAQKSDTVCKTGLQEEVALKAKVVGRSREYSCVQSNDHKSRYLLRHESFTLLTYIPSTTQTH